MVPEPHWAGHCHTITSVIVISLIIAMFYSVYFAIVNNQQSLMICIYQITHTHTHTQTPVSYTHLRAHETDCNLVCRLLLEKNFFNDTATTEIYTDSLVGSVRCV